MADRNPWDFDSWDPIAQYAFLMHNGTAAATARAREAGLLNVGTFNRRPYPLHLRLMYLEFPVGLAEAVQLHGRKRHRGADAVRCVGRRECSD
jgi:hypothetical protein